MTRDALAWKTWTQITNASPWENPCALKIHEPHHGKIHMHSKSMSLTMGKCAPKHMRIIKAHFSLHMIAVWPGPCLQEYLSRTMRKRVFGHMRTAKTQIRLTVEMISWPVSTKLYDWAWIRISDPCICNQRRYFLRHDYCWLYYILFFSYSFHRR